MMNIANTLVEMEDNTEIDEHASALTLCQENIKKYKCGFCNIRGHKINHCSDARLDILYQDLVSRFIFNYLLMDVREVIPFQLHVNNLIVFQNTIDYANTMTHIELKAIIYYMSKTTNIHANISHKRTCIEYLIHLCNAKYFSRGILNDMVIDLLKSWEKSHIDQILSEYKRDFPEDSELMHTVINYYRPPPRKFGFTIRQCAAPNDSDECHICFDTVPKCDMIYMNCNHTMCMTCMSGYFASILKSHCDPICSYCRCIMTNLHTNNADHFQYILDCHVIDNTVHDIESSTDIIQPVPLGVTPVHNRFATYPINTFRVAVMTGMFIIKHNRTIYMIVIVMLFLRLCAVY